MKAFSFDVCMNYICQHGNNFWFSFFFHSRRFSFVILLSKLLLGIVENNVCIVSVPLHSHAFYSDKARTTWNMETAKRLSRCNRPATKTWHTLSHICRAKHKNTEKKILKHSFEWNDNDRGLCQPKPANYNSHILIIIS